MDKFHEGKTTCRKRHTVMMLFTESLDINRMVAFIAKGRHTNRKQYKEIHENKFRIVAASRREEGGYKKGGE